MRWRSLGPLPRIPGRGSVGIGSVQRALSSDARCSGRSGRSAALSTAKLVRFHPTAANGGRRNRPKELQYSAGRRLPGLDAGSASAAAQIIVAASSCASPHPWAMDIRPRTTTTGTTATTIVQSQQQAKHHLQHCNCRNQTPATIPTATSSPKYPRIFPYPSPSPTSAPLEPFVLPASEPPPVRRPRHPPSFLDDIPSSTKMASETASASRASCGIKTTAAPVPGASLNQPTPSTAFDKATPSTFHSVSTRTQRPAHFLNRPVQSTRTATGTSSPRNTTSKRTMVSITPNSVNRTSLHPHGVQYVSPCDSLSFSLLEPATDVTTKQTA
jgi:hypothetical protein